MGQPIRVLVVVLLLPALLLQSCAPALQHRLRSPEQVRKIPRSAPFLNAHMKDGSMLSLESWHVSARADTVTGMGHRLDSDRTVVASGPFAFPVDSVALFETNAPEGMPPVLKALTIIVVSAGILVVVGIAAIAIACAADPKCFGSCPTFYVTDGSKPVLQAEGFSASVAPSLEATDVDALYRARPRSRDLEVTMTNEALETHVVRSVRVLAAPREPGTRVFATPDGAFWQARDLRAPARAMGPEGDCRALLEAFDTRERTSTVDSTDLAAREELDLEFTATPGESLGLVIASRQTLLTTYLFYESLAALGGSAGRFMAALERGDRTAVQGANALGRELGGLEVMVPGAGGWSRVTEMNEVGPIATDVKIVPLPRATGTTQPVRLRMARGSLRLDWVALARLDRRVEPARLEPRAVRRGDADDEDARAALLDSARTLVTGPGDRYALLYRLPSDPERCELFLETRGYYLEWMRERWIAMEDPARLAMIAYAPRQALREMAPAYAREQPALESWFWKSRYAHP